MFLLEHLKETHQDIYDLHVHNPEATVGFRVRLDGEIDRTQPLLLEQVCSGEERLETLVAVESVSQQQDTDVINMQYVMLDTKRKHRRSSETRSWFWKYFDCLSNIVYRCNLCNVVLSTKGNNTNNLNRHMRSKHPDTYKTEDIYANNKDVPETVGPRTRRSWIWSYFGYVTTTQAQCKIYKRQINHGGNATGNMSRHLKIMHNKTALKEITFGLSVRGFPVVHIGVHKFIKHESYRNKTRWTCSKRLQFGCKANLTTRENVMVRSYLHHNHEH